MLEPLLEPSEVPISVNSSIKKSFVNTASLKETQDHMTQNNFLGSVALNSSKALDNRMTHILHAMPSGIVILNANGVIEQVNLVACELLLQNVSGKAVQDEAVLIDEALSGSPLQGQLVGRPWRKIIKTAFVPQNDDGYEVSLRSGRRVSIAIRPLTPEPGQLIVLTDLTETRQLQKNVSHLQRLSALGKMVATLAHQIRTPLTAAILYAENLSHRHITQSMRDKFQKKLLNRLAELEHQVSDMLLTVKGQSLQIKRNISIGHIIEKVLDNCTPIAQKKQCQLSFENAFENVLEHAVNGGHSQGWLLADEPALVSAINNVLMNSIEAGASNIDLYAYEDGSHLVVEIIDDGCGLVDSTLMQQLKHQNRPFFTTKKQGTGLGLSVVRNVMTKHEGELTIVNRQEGEVKGCRVLLRFLKPLKKHVAVDKKGVLE
ncbi:PAS domain-containing sensor histidine kinase [uncultured Shewanella sp.]|uniref:sensor histidine kinase n=1 Tax=uncultured Shewanella sp. TaxID=173975 RepID=UPI002616E883|nr:PAS domain-containing sensor histidine kinase [uncultured Shewanella sp.]